MESGDVQAIQEEIEREVGMRPTGSPHAISIVLPDPPTS